MRGELNEFFITK